MLNGVFDYKRFSKTPNQPSPNAVIVTNSIDVNGPQGPPGEVDFEDASGFQIGATGHTGPTGLAGPTEIFTGQAILQSLRPFVANENITFGTQTTGFDAGYFDRGRFGLLDVSGNTMIPRRDGTINLGDIDAKFGNIYTKELSIISNTMHVLDPSGNNIKMSFDLDTQKSHIMFYGQWSNQFQNI